MNAAMRRALVFGIAVLASVVSSAYAGARDIQNPNAQQLNMLHAFLQGKPIDFEAQARNTTAFRNANEFDRANVLRQEVERLRAEYLSSAEINELIVNVRGSFSDYDSATGGFNLDLFRPGVYVNPAQTAPGLLFDNNEEFRTWKLDVPSARAVLAKTRNNRTVTFEVRAKPFAVDTTGHFLIRTQVRQVRIIDSASRTVLADIKSSEPAKRIAAPGVFAIPEIPANKLNVMGLQHGATYLEFMRWAKANNLHTDVDQLGSGMLERWAPPGYKPPTLRKNAEGIVLLPAFTDTHEIAFAATELSKQSLGEKISKYDVAGENLDCGTKDQLKQTCGRVRISKGEEDQSDRRKVMSFDIVQNLNTGDTASILNDVTSKFGNYNDAFDVVLGKYRGRHYVWGQSFEKNWTENGAAIIGNQGKSWPVEVFILQVSGNRSVLIVQINGSHSNSGATAAEKRPRL